MDYAVEGLVPDSGASVWFGPGSTGKTQLLLSLAAHIAAPRGTGPTEWLGAEICRRGHILVLSAEDLREHLFLRIGGIAHSMKKAYPDIDVKALCERIHVVPYLSLTEEEFTGSNPCLFRGKRDEWRRTASMKDVEEFIESWNGSASDDDKIVGVILDSAVSMSGFELSNSAATTNLLFRINRVSRRQNVFWAIVGHTPKNAAIKEDPTAGAVERLRGSAMWSTAPRTVVELRIAGETENLSDVRRAYPGLGRRDIVIAMVVKANSKGADFRPRVLRRLSEGAFEDLTDDFPSVCAAWDPTGSISPTSVDAEKIQAVSGLIRNITRDGSAGATFKRAEIEAEFKDKAGVYPALEGVINETERSKERSQEHLAYFLQQLVRAGGLERTRTGLFVVKNLAPPVAEAA